MDVQTKRLIALLNCHYTIFWTNSFHMCPRISDTEIFTLSRFEQFSGVKVSLMHCFITSFGQHILENVVAIGVIICNLQSL